MPISPQLVQEEIQRRKNEKELLKCKVDRFYWLTHYVWTLDPHDKENPIKLFPNKEYLEEIVKLWEIEKLFLLEKSRQMMVTWLFCALSLHEVQFENGKYDFFQSKKEEDANALVDRAKFIFHHQPEFLKQPIEDTYCKFKFPKNNSQIIGIPQGGDQIRMHTASRVFCVGPETKVLTGDLRWVSIKEIKEGDVLAGIDENVGDSGYRKNGAGRSRQWHYAKVQNVARLVRPCYRLKFEDGTEIISSQEHRWLAGFKQRWKWITTKDLRVQNGNRAGSKVVKIAHVWQEDNDYNAGYLAGAFDGEGCLDQRSYNDERGLVSDVGLSFSQNENVMLDRVKEILESKNFHFTGERKIKKGYAKIHHVIYLSIHSEAMKFLGTIRPKRLLAKFNLEKWGRAKSLAGVNLIEKEFIGNKKVVGLSTSTKTLVAEGLASHNSDEMGFQTEAEEAFTAARPCIEGGGAFNGVSSANPGFFQELCEEEGEWIEIRKGLTKKYTPSGFCVVRLHYTADPIKATSEWKEGAKKGFKHEDKWKKEYEIDFTALGGTLVYPEIESRIGEIYINPFEIPQHWRRYAGLDPGVRNPTACHFYAVDEKGNIYAYWELYEKEIHYKDLARILKEHEDFEKVKRSIFVDPIVATKVQHTKFGIKSFKELLEQEGIFTISGNRDRMAGAEKIREYIDDEKLKIFKTCPRLLEEIESLRYEEWTGDRAFEKNIREEIVARNDHAWSDLRYVLMSNPLTAKKPILGIEARIKKVKKDIEGDIDSHYRVGRVISPRFSLDQVLFVKPKSEREKRELNDNQYRV